MVVFATFFFLSVVLRCAFCVSSVASTPLLHPVVLVSSFLGVRSLRASSPQSLGECDLVLLTLSGYSCCLFVRTNPPGVCKGFTWTCSISDLRQYLRSSSSASAWPCRRCSSRRVRVASTPVESESSAPPLVLRYKANMRWIMLVLRRAVKSSAPTSRPLL